MARGPVMNYTVEWKARERKGVLKLRVWTASTTIEEFSVPVNNSQEMQVLVDLVRNEKPLSYDSETMTIATGAEAVGEGEKRRIKVRR